MPVASETGGGEFQLPPPGAHPARCVQVIDLGTHHDAYMGKPKITRKVRIAWELPNEKAVFSEERGEESFIVGKEYTLSLGQRANLRHDLESWRGRDFTEEELKGFDLKVLLGKSCLVNVIHRLSAQKRNYAQVTSVTPLPKGTQVPKASLPKINYEITDGEGGQWKELPEWIQAKLKESDEFRNVAPGKEPQEQPGEDDDAF